MTLLPQLPPGAYRTYAIAAPLATHWRPATCAEAACPHYLNGWETRVDETTELGQRQAHFIRHDASRRHAERRDPAGLTVFTFEAGQACFGQARHRTRLEREERFLIRGGDRRGDPAGLPATELTPAQWTDDFGEHQDRLAAQQRKG